jgi:hypothetical protein
MLRCFFFLGCDLRSPHTVRLLAIHCLGIGRIYIALSAQREQVRVFPHHKYLSLSRLFCFCVWSLLAVDGSCKSFPFSTTLLSFLRVCPLIALLCVFSPLSLSLLLLLLLLPLLLLLLLVSDMSSGSSLAWLRVHCSPRTSNPCLHDMVCDVNYP